MLSTEYERCYQAVFDKISKSNVFTLTSDSERSINNNSFLAVTAHFIDKEGKLQSILLDCGEFNEKHNAENTANFWKKVTKNWKIPKKITAIVTDNASMMIAAAKFCNWRHIG